MTNLKNEFSKLQRWIKTVCRLLKYMIRKCHKERRTSNMKHGKNCSLHLYFLKGAELLKQAQNQSWQRDY